MLSVNSHGVAKYLLSRAVRDAGYKVVLTGEGSDEILAGYMHFRNDLAPRNGNQSSSNVGGAFRKGCAPDGIHKLLGRAGLDRRFLRFISKGAWADVPEVSGNIQGA